MPTKCRLITFGGSSEVGTKTDVDDSCGCRSHFRFSSTRPLVEVVIACLRSLCDAWRSTARFGNAPSACLFMCGSPAGDCQAHLLLCLVLRRWVDLQSLRFLALPSPLGIPTAIAVEVALWAADRGHRCLPRSVFASILKEVALRHPECRRALPQPIACVVFLVRSVPWLLRQARGGGRTCGQDKTAPFGLCSPLAEQSGLGHGHNFCCAVHLGIKKALAFRRRLCSPSARRCLLAWPFWHVFVLRVFARRFCALVLRLTPWSLVPCGKQRSGLQAETSRSLCGCAPSPSVGPPPSLRRRHASLWTTSARATSSGPTRNRRRCCWPPRCHSKSSKLAAP